MMWIGGPSCPWPSRSPTRRSWSRWLGCHAGRTCRCPVCRSCSGLRASCAAGMRPSVCCIASRSP
eukprot:1198399-Heterocapsa_arctica.AAC.1